MSLSKARLTKEELEIFYDFQTVLKLTHLGHPPAVRVYHKIWNLLGQRNCEILNDLVKEKAAEEVERKFGMSKRSAKEVARVLFAVLRQKQETLGLAEAARGEGKGDKE